jgi:putative resolvase
LHPNPNGKWLFDITSEGVAPSPVDDGGPSSPTDIIQAIYARVSTRKQLNDLQSQIRILKAKYPDHTVFSDCASGLNFKRKSLLSLLQLAFERCLRVVRVAHRDRLCRFAFDLLEHVFRVHGAEIVMEASDLPPSTERELAEDVRSVITVFGALLNGARSSGRRGRGSAEDQETQAAGGKRSRGIGSSPASEGHAHPPATAGPSKKRADPSRGGAADRL